MHGGTSGIGTTAIQLAKAVGAKVIATAGSPEKCKACLEIGADRAINYKTEDFVAAAREATSGKGVDVTLDMVGGDYTERNIAAAAEEGRIVQIAVLGGADIKINIARLMMKRVTLTGSTLRPRTREAKAGFARALEAKVWPLLASGKVRRSHGFHLPAGQGRRRPPPPRVRAARRQGGAGGVGTGAGLGPAEPLMRTDLFDFDLPDAAIALEPASPRDAARLLVVHPSSPSPRTTSAWGEGTALEDRLVRDLPDLLRPGDALVFNDTRVIRAALQGERVRGENRAQIAFNLHKRIDESRWRAFARPAKRLATGDRIRFGHDGRVCLLGTLDASVSAIGEAGEVELSFSLHGAYLDEAIAALGDPPLPPYIANKRALQAEDAERYQTVYARRDGAVAAPTAGLHFTPALLAALDARGISRHCVTLHVGAGTFLPVKAEDTAAHRMHAESGEISADTAAALNAARAAGARLVAVGTTSLRLLETAAVEDGTIRPFAGETEIFITPGYRFKATDLLLTNFHLPRSTLFMLVAAFSGLDTMRAAYAHAIAAGYRFYSYGDASLLYPASVQP